MSREFTQEDAKAHACSYILLGLLQRMDEKEPGLIEELIAGAEEDFAAVKLQDNLPTVVTQIFRETIAMLTRANAYKQPASDLRRGDEGA